MLSKELKDLTPAQAAFRLRKLFPSKTCYANCEACSYDHLDNNPKHVKKIYVSDIDDICHIEGPSFHILLRMATLIKERM